MRLSKCAIALFSLLGAMQPSCSRTLPPADPLVDLGARSIAAWIPASTSIDTPVTPGSRTTPSLPIDPASGGSTRWRSATSSSSATSWTRPSTRPGAARPRRRSAIFSPRAWTRGPSMPGAPRPSRPKLGRIAALTDADALAPLLAHLHSIGVDAFFRMSRSGSPRRAHGRRHPRSGRDRAARSRRLHPRRSQGRRDPDAVPEHIEKMLVLLSESLASKLAQPTRTRS